MMFISLCYNEIILNVIVEHNSLSFVVGASRLISRLLYSIHFPRMHIVFEHENLMCHWPWMCVQSKTLYVTHFKFWFIHYQGPRIHEGFLHQRCYQEHAHNTFVLWLINAFMLSNRNWLVILNIVPTTYMTDRNHCWDISVKYNSFMFAECNHVVSVAQCSYFVRSICDSIWMRECSQLKFNGLFTGNTGFMS